MGKRRFSPGNGSNPLELMLDTLSNVFGGIVLIACLLALMPRNEDVDASEAGISARGELLERRILLAEEDLKETKALIAEKGEEEDPEIARLRQEFQRLNRYVKELRDLQRDQAKGEVDSARLEALALSSDPEVYQHKLSQLEARLELERNKEKAIEDKERFLVRRKDRLKKQLNNLEKGSIEEVRFPKERSTDRDPFPIILRYGKVFPLRIGKTLQTNPALRLIIKDSKSVIYDPIPSEGIVKAGQSAGLKAALQSVKARGGYASVYVYKDSHKAFRDLRGIFDSIGINYGMEFCSDKNLVFSSEGSKPPEL